MEELANWSGPLGLIAHAALGKVRPHALIRDFVSQDGQRDNESIRSLVGTVIASGLAQFKRGKLVPTEQLLSHVGSAEAMRDACWEAIENGGSDLQFPDGSDARDGDEIDDYPFIGVALEGHPVTLGRWDVTDRQLAIYRVLGVIGMGGMWVLLPLHLALVGLVLVAMIPVVAIEALISDFRRRH